MWVVVCVSVLNCQLVQGIPRTKLRHPSDSGCRTENGWMDKGCTPFLAFAPMSYNPFLEEMYIPAIFFSQFWQIFHHNHKVKCRRTGTKGDIWIVPRIGWISFVGVFKIVKLTLCCSSPSSCSTNLGSDVCLKPV